MPEHEPTFSVIIPTRDRAAELGGAIEGVLAQAFTDFELIVVDDGSGDDTVGVVAGFDDSRLEYVSQPRTGVAAARNRGAAAARGRFLVFLDSDDRPDPAWLGSFARALAEGASLVMAPGMWFDQNGETELIPLRDLGAEYGHQVGLYLPGNFAIARELFNDAEGYDERLTYAENQELFLRVVPLCLERRLVMTTFPDPHLRRRKRDPDRRYDREKFESMGVLVNTHFERLSMNRRMLSDLLAVRGVSAARLGLFSEAKRSFAKASKVRPTNTKNLVRLIMATVPAAARSIWGTSRQDHSYEQGVEE